jgi:hypothetical protein
VDISANTYAYTAWFNTFSAFIPPWAHDGGDAKLIERLKDPTIRARIRKELITPGGGWDNEWQEIPSPEAILIAVVQNPELASLQGKRLSEVAAMWNEDPIDAMCDLLIKDKAFTEVAVFGMSEPDVLLALQQPWVSIDNDSQGTTPDGPLGQEHPHPRAYGTFPRILRKYVREEHALSDFESNNSCGVEARDLPAEFGADGSCCAGDEDHLALERGTNLSFFETYRSPSKKILDCHLANLASEAASLNYLSQPRDSFALHTCFVAQLQDPGHLDAGGRRDGDQNHLDLMLCYE